VIPKSGLWSGADDHARIGKSDTFARLAVLRETGTVPRAYSMLVEIGHFALVLALLVALVRPSYCRKTLQFMTRTRRTLWPPGRVQ
jgi:hypothetical protein